MKAKLINTQRNPSKYGGYFWYFFFKLEDGRSARSCISEKMRNFRNWKELCGKEDIELDGLFFTRSGIIDADSNPKIINNGQTS